MKNESAVKDPSRLADLLARAEEGRKKLVAESRTKKADLPLKFLRQQAHFTTPASDLGMVTKAVENGLTATTKILEKFKISHGDLANALGVPVAEIEAVLAGDPHSPLVMVDGEDAQALRDDVVARGRENAVKVFKEAAWGRTLRFYRPSGLQLKYCTQDLFHVLTGVAGGKNYPIDGIIWPKVEHPAQIAWVCDTLGTIEREIGLPENHIKLQFLVESGWALMQLPEIVHACVPRLAGIIFGIADYSADINLPAIINDHPVCDVARSLIVNMCGAVGVPAIDNMTVNYPVASKALDETGNRAHILARLKECFDDARHGYELGMDGKWVGHPAQLFAALLAYRSALPQKEIDAEVSKIEEYDKAVAAELGATIIAGVMSDRATDRHARARLRKAVALGRIDATRAAALGIIDPSELAQLNAAGS